MEHIKHIADCDDVKFLREEVQRLWNIIDDIDTLSDMIKPMSIHGYRLYYEKVNEKVKKRFGNLGTDGYGLYINDSAFQRYNEQNIQKNFCTVDNHTLTAQIEGQNK